MHSTSMGCMRFSQTAINRFAFPSDIQFELVLFAQTISPRHLSYLDNVYQIGGSYPLQKGLKKIRRRSLDDRPGSE